MSRPASEDRRLALNVDVTATIAEAAGVAPPADIEGVPLLGYAEREGFVLESPVTNGSDGGGQKVARPGYCGYRTRRFALRPVLRRHRGALRLPRAIRWSSGTSQRDGNYAGQLATLRAPNRRRVPAATARLRLVTASTIRSSRNVDSLTA